MNRIGVSILLTATLVVGALPSASAVVKPTPKCSPAGDKTIYKGKIYTCIKLGNKLSWNNGVIYKAPPIWNPTGSLCIPGSNCPLGSTGPGGGIVFYDAGSQQSWGRYLEVAPGGWSGNTTDPETSWCDVVVVDLEESTAAAPIETSLGFQIGKGKANTELMLKNCSSGAGVVAQAYKGGGKNDWYLPSKNELNEVCKYARSQPTGKSKVLCDEGGKLRKDFVNPDDFYWSSTEEDYKNQVWGQFFDGLRVGIQLYVFKKFNTANVRPIRAF
jgi:hypothetical protein